MHSIRDDMEALRGQLREGSVQRGYRALLSYIMSLRKHFKSAYPGCGVSGLYQGRMDATYFALFPPRLKQRNLKIAIVFNYDAFRFEAWLAGKNRMVQRQCWELLKDSEWPRYRVITPGKGVDSIVECDLAEDFDLGDPETLTTNIESATIAFVDDIERFLSQDQPFEATPE